MTRREETECDGTVCTIKHIAYCYRYYICAGSHEWYYLVYGEEEKNTKILANRLEQQGSKLSNMFVFSCFEYGEDLCHCYMRV